MIEPSTDPRTAALQKALETEGRFRIESVLGEGGMGLVYSAHDNERGELVALKTLRHGAPAALQRLKDEFRSLSELRHPNLASLYELHQGSDASFFTMEFVRGDDLLTHVHRRTEPDAISHDAPTVSDAEDITWDVLADTLESGDIVETKTPSQFDATATTMEATTTMTHPSDEDYASLVSRVRDVMSQLVAGVRFLHAHGKIHRDLKPSNVVVTPERRVVLLDFGLVSNSRIDFLQQRTQQSLAGTVPYIAPEQTLDEVAPSNDWYAIGVILFELLTGIRPFDGPPIRTLLMKSQRPAVSVDAVEPRVPADLAAACALLLERDPSEREQGLAVFEADATSPSSFGDDEVFVGRKRELAVLAQAMEDVRSGGARVVALSGESGVGKSALFRQFLTTRGDDDVRILGGKCYERDSVPFKAFDAVVDTLGHQLSHDAELTDSVLPEDADALGRMFPVLRRVSAVDLRCASSEPSTDAVAERRRAFAAVRELVASLASDAPLVIAIDDAQWSDIDSAALLQRILEPSPPPGVLFVLGFRKPEAAGTAMLEVFEDFASRQPECTVAVELEALSADDAVALACALLGEETSTASIVAEQSGGSPFLLREMALGWSPELDQSGEVDANRLLSRRLDTLSPAERDALELVAVSAGPLTETVLAASVDGDARTEVASLAAQQLVRVRPVRGGDAAECFHDRVREYVASSLEEPRARELHGRLATSLEAHQPGDVESLAHHFARAGEHTRAAEYSVQAAERAASALAFLRSARFYADALEYGEFDPVAVSELTERMAESLVNAGRVREAGEAFVESAAHDSGARRVDLLRRASEQFLIGGYVDEGSTALEDVLRATSVSPIRNRLLLLVMILLWRFRVALLLRKIGGDFEPSKTLDDDALLRIDACHAVSTGHGLIDLAQSALFQHRATYHALRDGDAYRVVRAIMGEVAYSSTGGVANAEQTRVLLGQARDFIDENPSTRAEAILLGSKVLVASNEGRWTDALHDSRVSLERLAAEPGLNWEVMAIRVFRLWALALGLKFEELRRETAELLDEAKARGNRQTETLVTTGPAQIGWLSSGDVETARVELKRAIQRWTDAGFHLQHAYAMVASINIASMDDDPDAAWKIASETWPQLKGSLLMYHQQFSILTATAIARAAIFYSARRQDAADSRRARKLAEKCLSRLDGAAEPYATGYADVLRAEAAVGRGDIESARKLLAGARDSFDPEQQSGDVLGAQLAIELLDGERGEAWRAFEDAGVVDPRQFARVYMPVICSQSRLEPQAEPGATS